MSTLLRPIYCNALRRFHQLVHLPGLHAVIQNHPQTSSPFCRFFAVGVLEFPAFLSESLEVLCLNDNHLDSVPPSVCLLKSLSELYLGK